MEFDGIIELHEFIWRSLNEIISVFIQSGV